ncbi:MAG: hypothetical protein ACOCP8_05235 [archaeon]
MNLKNCPQCGKLFNKIGNNKICQVCQRGIENDFEKVKKYLWDNHNATM